MSNILTLPNYLPPVTGKPDPQIIEMLEKALGEARSGNLQGLAICTVICDGTDSPIIAADFYYRCSAVSMLWAVDLLRHRFHENAFS